MKYTDPDLRSSPLLTIDVQRDFALPGAPAEIPGTMDVVPHIVRLLNTYRASETDFRIKLYHWEQNGGFYED